MENCFEDEYNVRQTCVFAFFVVSLQRIVSTIELL